MPGQGCWQMGQEAMRLYNVNDDPRCLRSCQAIGRALFDLLPERDYQIGRIEVSDIATRSGVSRATFYRHFDTVFDVLCWASNEEVEATVDAGLISVRDYRSFCERFFQHWAAHGDFLALLVRAGHPEVFYRSLERALDRMSDRLFSDSRLSPERQSYLVSVWSGIVWSILGKWVQRGCVETPEELADIALHNLPSPR